jgi:hypothetical protein
MIGSAPPIPEKDVLLLATKARIGAIIDCWSAVFFPEVEPAVFDPVDVASDVSIKIELGGMRIPIDAIKPDG